MTTTSRKVLLPLATLVAAGAVAIGSGATFSSETGSTITATSGTLKHLNSSTGETQLLITGLKPGGTAEGTVTITNDGSLSSDLKVIASGASGELASALQIEIVGEEGSSGFPTGDFEDVDNSADGYDLGSLVAGGATPDSIVVTVTVTMRDQGSAIDNTFQDKSAGLTLKFVTTQTDEDDESDVSGWNMS